MLQDQLKFELEFPRICNSTLIRDFVISNMKKIALNSTLMPLLTELVSKSTILLSLTYSSMIEDMIIYEKY